MRTRVLFIPANSHRAVTLMDTDGSLEAFQSLVGGNIEIVELYDVGQHSLYINEEGKLQHLQFNSRATLMFHRGVGITLDVIMGDAFIAGPTDDDGNDTDVDSAIVQMVRGL